MLFIHLIVSSCEYNYAIEFSPLGVVFVCAESLIHGIHGIEETLNKEDNLSRTTSRRLILSPSASSTTFEARGLDNDFAPGHSYDMAVVFATVTVVFDAADNNSNHEQLHQLRKS